MAHSGKAGEMKGRLMGAAGAPLRDAEQQRREGQADQSSAKLKQAGERLGDAADDVKHALTR